VLKALLPVVFASEPPPSLVTGTACRVGGLSSPVGARYVVGNAVPGASTEATTGVRVVGSPAATGVAVVGTGKELVGCTATAGVGAELDGATSVGAITGESCDGCVPVGTPDAAVGAAVTGTVATTPDT
jgi:hypothetical protein